MNLPKKYEQLQARYESIQRLMQDKIEEAEMLNDELAWTQEQYEIYPEDGNLRERLEEITLHETSHLIATLKHYESEMEKTARMMTFYQQNLHN